MRHVAAVARAARLDELIADVLPDNLPMLKVFENSGLPVRTKREPGVVQVVIELS